MVLACGFGLNRGVARWILNTPTDAGWQWAGLSSRRSRVCGARHAYAIPIQCRNRMRILHADRHEQLFAAGMAWLLLLFVAGVMAATRPVVDQVPVHLQALAGASLSRDGGALLLPGGRTRDVAAELKFTLPPPDPAMSRWVVWFGRDPVDALWLQSATPAEMTSPRWRTVQRDFFHPDPDEGTLPSGFVLPLPTTWQGEITLTVHAREASALRCDLACSVRQQPCRWPIARSHCRA